MKTASVWRAFGALEARGAQSLDGDVRGLIQLLVDRLAGAPTFLVVHATEGCDLACVARVLREELPDVPVHGGTSCQGVMTDAGFHTGEGGTLALFGVRDPEGAYGTGAATLQPSAHDAAGQALKQALEQAGRVGEAPPVIMLGAAPGQEETVLAGMAAVVGPSVPVVGGSSADNRIQGHWQQLANGDVQSNAAVVSVLFPSTDVAYAFHSGYSPSTRFGIITQAEGRELLEIDGEPAATVYNRWTEGAIQDALPAGGVVLASSTFHPLGRVVGSVGGVPYYSLSHPESVTPRGGLTLFTDVAVGERLILMEGTRKSLLTRAARVVAAALESRGLTRDAVAGAYVIFCAGCMLAVQDEMRSVAAGITEALGDKPFIGSFTFGEQGCLPGGENCHGNLMISILLFIR